MHKELFDQLVQVVAAPYAAKMAAHGTKHRPTKP